MVHVVAITTIRLSQLTPTVTLQWSSRDRRVASLHPCVTQDGALAIRPAECKAAPRFDVARRITNNLTE